MARPASYGPRVTKAIRMDPILVEVLNETAEELGIGFGRLVNLLCEEGLNKMELIPKTYDRRSL